MEPETAAENAKNLEKMVHRKNGASNGNGTNGNSLGIRTLSQEEPHHEDDQHEKLDREISLEELNAELAKNQGGNFFGDATAGAEESATDSKVIDNAGDQRDAWGFGSRPASSVHQVKRSRFELLAK